MSRRRNMSSIRGYRKGELQDKIREARGELAKLRVVSTKGTLKKDSGRLRPIRRDIARMETRLTEIIIEEYARQSSVGGRGGRGAV